MRTRYDKPLLERAVRDKTSIASVLRSLGLTPSGGNYRHIQRLLRFYGIDVSHFKGQAHARGTSKETSPSVARGARARSLSDAEVFCNPSKASSGVLRRRYRSRFPHPQCALCGIAEWRGRPLTLHVDHVNGIDGDNRLDNLRYLCPNCHQQTETWGHSSGRVV